MKLRSFVMKTIVSLITLFLVSVISFSAWAQGATLSQDHKLQYLNGAVAEANKQIKKGDHDQAKYSLLSVITFVQQFARSATRSPIKEVFAGYMAARNAAWKKGPAMSDSTVNKFFEFWKKNKAEFMRLSGVYGWQNMPDGVNEYRRRVTQMLSEYKSARALAGKLAALAPPPDLILQNRAVYTKMFREQIFVCLYHMHFGPANAAQMALQRVIPDAKKEVSKQISQAKKSKKPSRIWVHIGLAKEQYDMLSSIEAVLREELPQKKLAAELPGMLKQMEAENKRAGKIMDKMIDENRMPGDNWQGANKGAYLKAVKAAYKKAYPNEKIMRITIQSKNFHEQWESWWRRNTLITQYGGYLDAAIAVKQKSGKHRVFYKRFRRARLTGGKWSPLKVHSTIRGYLIRPQNINK